MKCWRHDWTRWIVLSDEKMAAKDGAVIGQMLTQQRECMECGKIERHVVTTTVYS